MQVTEAYVALKSRFREAMNEIGVISDLQAIVWDYFELKCFSFGSPILGTSPLHPLTVTVDQNGLVLVADAGNRRVQTFDPDGKLLKTINTGPLTGVVSGPGGSVYTCHKRIEVFTSSGTFSHTIGRHGSEDGQFSSIRGMALSEDNLLHVLNEKQHRVLVFTSEGKYLPSFGEKDLGTPRGIAIDQGDIYIADNKICSRVLGFHSSGKRFRTIQHADMTGHLMGVAVSPTGFIYITDVNGLIWVFNPHGKFVRYISSFKGERIRLPGGIAISSEGMVYLSDVLARRILAFPALF